MRIGEGPHNRGVMVRWQASRYTGMLSLDRCGNRRNLSLGSVYRWKGTWVAFAVHRESPPFAHRWQAKRWVEQQVGDRVRRNAELAANSVAFYPKAVRALNDLAAAALDGSAEVRCVSDALRRMGDVR